MRSTLSLLAASALFGLAAAVQAKPIAFQGGTTFMHERDSNMLGTELFYAPKVWWSLGPAHAIMKNDARDERHVISVVQTNFLLNRWNLPNAQGNLFASAGVGRARTEYTHGPHGVMRTRERAERYTVQGDYETRQIYTSFKLDHWRGETFSDRSQTIQAGFSPVPHDYEDLAIWFIGQVKRTRGMDNKTEAGAFIRLFRKNVWLEIGVTEGRRSQMMLMLNY